MKRINMLQSKNSTIQNAVKYSGFFTVFVLALYLVSCSNQGESDNPPVAPPPPAEEEKAEVVPSFPGGIEEMMNFLTEEIKYPESAKNEGVSGRVMLQFTVDVNGKLKDINVVNGVHPDLDAEALRAVQAMPDWVPGTKNGEAVPMQMMLPVMFSLPKEESSEWQGSAANKATYAFTLNLSRGVNMS